MFQLDKDLKFKARANNSLSRPVCLKLWYKKHWGILSDFSNVCLELFTSEAGIWIWEQRQNLRRNIALPCSQS